MRYLRKFYKAFHKSACALLTEEKLREISDSIDWELLDEGEKEDTQ